MPLARFWSSTIGKKTVMAVTGIVLVGYILAHVTANLLVFVGPEAIDGYAASLREFPILLWGVRILLLVSVVLHIVAAAQLAVRARAARPVGYQRFEPQVSSPASRTMRWGGVALALFVGRDQRGEELPERRRQHLAPFLRHDQGRRFPRARGERVPPRADQRRHH